MPVQGTHVSENLANYLAAAELYWYQGRPVDAQNLLDSLFAGAHEPSERAPAWILQSKLFAQAGNLHGAFTALKTSLLELGLDITATPTWKDCDRQFSTISKRLQEFDFATITDRPVCTKVNMIAVGKVAIEAVSAGFWSNALLVCCCAPIDVAVLSLLTNAKVLSIGT